MNCVARMGGGVARMGRVARMARAAHVASVVGMGTSVWLVLALALGAVQASADPGAPHDAYGHRRESVRATAHRHRARARAAIVGGTPISVERAPWQVTVEASYKTTGGTSDSILCGGSIIDTSHILTAAHCVFIAPPGERIPPSDFVVIAGTSNLKTHESTEQDVAVAGVRVHPYYKYDPGSGHINPDDVAMLELAEPLVPGADVQPIALPPLGVYPSEGTALQFTGFGAQNASPQELNGQLYSLDMSLGSSESCGGENNAVILCASGPSGSPCSGDSGSALTTAVSSPVLLGVENDGLIVEGHDCVDGDRNSYANVVAPEIQDFIDGSESPPRAPRGGGTNCAVPTPMVGDTMTCQPGAWSGEPAFMYTFSNASTGQVLQSGASSSYQFTPAAAGSPVVMRLQATNVGGAAIDQATPTALIQPAAQTEAPPPPPAPSARIALLGAAITVKDGGVALVKLSCRGSAPCHGKLTLTARVAVQAKNGRGQAHGRMHTRTVVIATATYAIPAGRTSTVSLRLDPTGRRLLARDHGRLAAALAILKSSPSPASTQHANVHLLQARVTRRR